MTKAQVAGCVRLPSLHKLLDELPALPWVEVEGLLREMEHVIGS